MKTFLQITSLVLLIVSCSHPIDKEAIKKEIFEAEKSFEKMASEKGISEAFYFYAAENAVIKRENDTLIIGKANIKAYYEKTQKSGVTVSWTPDYIDVSDCGTLGYTYGKYSWKIKGNNNTITEYKGVFHTVWKRQPDRTWRYVWD